MTELNHDHAQRMMDQKRDELHVLEYLWECEMHLRNVYRRLAVTKLSLTEHDLARIKETLESSS